MKNTKLRKEHVRLIADCKQMAGRILHVNEVNAAALGDEDALEAISSLKDLILELNGYKFYLAGDRNRVLPDAVVKTYSKKWDILSDQVAGMEAGKKKFQELFREDSTGNNNSKEHIDILLKVGIITIFSICMWVFFYSQL